MLSLMLRSFTVNTEHELHYTMHSPTKLTIKKTNVLADILDAVEALSESLYFSEVMTLQNKDEDATIARDYYKWFARWALQERISDDDEVGMSLSEIFVDNLGFSESAYNNFSDSKKVGQLLYDVKEILKVNSLSSVFSSNDSS